MGNFTGDVALTNYTERRPGTTVRKVNSGITSDIRKKFATDAEQFTATGEMYSYTGSFFTRDKNEVMSTAAGISYKFTLAEELDEERLKEATLQALKHSPYMAYSLRFNETEPRLTLVNSDANFPVFNGYLPKSYAEKELNGHFGFVSFSGNELTVSVCHVITDGCGFLWFVNALLDAYFNRLPQTVWTDYPDWAADVMKYTWPLPENFKPCMDNTKDIFRLPPRKKIAGGFHKRCFIDYQSFAAFCRNTGLSPQGAGAYILAKSLQASNPDNNKTFRLRCPINTRTVLRIPHTFQNACIPHIYLNFYPQELGAALTENKAERINKEIRGQLSYEYAADMTNIFAKAAKSADKADFDNVILNYVRQSELFISYVRRVVGSSVSKVVFDMAPAYTTAPPFPVMLYFLELGDKIVLQYDQDFDDSSCWEELCKILTDLEIKCI